MLVTICFRNMFSSFRSLGPRHCILHTQGIVLSDQPPSSKTCYPGIRRMLSTVSRFYQAASPSEQHIATSGFCAEDSERKHTMAAPATRDFHVCFIMFHIISCFFGALMFRHFSSSVWIEIKSSQLTGCHDWSRSLWQEAPAKRKRREKPKRLKRRPNKAIMSWLTNLMISGLNISELWKTVGWWNLCANIQHISFCSGNKVVDPFSCSGKNVYRLQDFVGSLSWCWNLGQGGGKEKKRRGTSL